jgi:hypothetical protein
MFFDVQNDFFLILKFQSLYVLSATDMLPWHFTSIQLGHQTFWGALAYMQNICTYFFSLHIPLSFEEFDTVAQVLRTFFLTRQIYNSNWFFLVHILVTIIRLKAIFLSSMGCAQVSPPWRTTFRW